MTMNHGQSTAWRAGLVDFRSGIDSRGAVRSSGRPNSDGGGTRVIGRAGAAIEYLTPFPRWSTAVCPAMVSLPVCGDELKDSG